ncbi:hypothetical protein RclHR1_06710012 [Rhizophagus clarus]|uniref:Galactose oxidase n=1 Tax=Rhizophagus clarus TaxID=94130 RepID=A0A2Z6SAU6_9GLOM|nr:hypothetical protein RclHR1_06710012 [Rhizophagus clarus]GES73185.1 hypothetical protein GLOIN_2v1725607 [Rhizophagus clarus]
MERSFHTATLINNKIFFIGGKSNNVLTNDFFYLDTSKKFDKSKSTLPLVNLNDKSLNLPKHYGATTSSFGELKDSIFFFGGDIGNSNDPSKLVFSFNTTQLEWKNITISQSMILNRRRYLSATIDNNNKIYLFGGEFVDPINSIDNSNETNIFNPLLNNWTIGKIGPVGRKGHTATFLPKTNEIIYIGGYGEDSFIDITNLDVYNTTNDTWNKVTTTNPPEPRFLHTAVLTNDDRIIIYGGVGNIVTILPIVISTDVPVLNYYVVLDTNTLEWHHSVANSLDRAPYKGHTATLINGLMFIAFGSIYSADKPFNNDILIYKIGDYANFTELFTTEDPPKDPPDRFKLIKPIVGAASSVLLVTVIIGFAGIKIRNKYIKHPGERPPEYLMPEP